MRNSTTLRWAAGGAAGILVALSLAACDDGGGVAKDLPLSDPASQLQGHTPEAAQGGKLVRREIFSGEGTGERSFVIPPSDLHGVEVVQLAATCRPVVAAKLGLDGTSASGNCEPGASVIALAPVAEVATRHELVVKVPAGTEFRVAVVGWAAQD